MAESEALLIFDTPSTPIPGAEVARNFFDPYLPCDEKQLRRVYLQLALKYHPDKWPASQKAEATRIFQSITIVYEQILRPHGRSVRRVKSAAAAAAELGDLAELRRLLDEVPGRVGEKDDGGVSPLMYAAKGGNIESVLLLLDRGADLHAKTPLAWSALLWGALSDHSHVVECLINHGAAVTENDLILATFKGSFKSLCVMAKHFPGGVARLRTDTNGQSLLHLVCFGICNLARESPERYVSCALLLLREGVPVDVTDTRHARTCLQTYVSHAHWARLGFEASEAHLELVRVLCAHGADVTAQDGEGKSAMSMAASGGLPRVLRVLTAFLPVPSSKF